MTTTTIETTVVKTDVVTANQIPDQKPVISLEFQDAEIGDIKVRFVGDINILDLPGIAVAISSPPTKDGKIVIPTPKRAIAFAKSAGKWLAENNKVVLSGGFRGVDGYAMDEAINNGGKVAVFVPMGLGAIFEAFKPDMLKKVNSLIKEGRLLIVSTRQKDSAPWSNEESMKRNGLLAQRSDGILIPHMVGSWVSKEMTYTGGIINLAYQAERDNVPVFVPAWRKGEHLFMGILPRILSNVVYLKDEDENEYDNVFSEMIG